jgi:hypothetical protein
LSMICLLLFSFLLLIKYIHQILLTKYMIKWYSLQRFHFSIFNSQLTWNKDQYLENLKF